MRYVVPLRPIDGDVRTRRGFLLLPKMIRDEIRWLEHATWRETYYIGYLWAGWLPFEWIKD